MKSVLILGSGGLKIGQAGEFDYSGSQAIKALKSEGIRTVLVNPNIATVQTDEGLADEVYLQPLNLDTVEEIIKRERPDGIMLGFGGQTALNLGLELDLEGVLKKYGVKVLGTPVSTIRVTEDRQLFKESLEAIGVRTARSRTVTDVEEAILAAEEFGYPLMIRSGFSLGGLGSGKISSQAELRRRAQETLNHVPQILLEEYLGGWKEIEYEVLRDEKDNCLIVCNMENFDPMGIHTGESIVVAPSQTLSNEEYHLLREIAIRTIRHLGIIGECNIQYCLDPETGDYRVIEVNARLSRSSALASKATGYPIAYVAAKLSIGQTLDSLKNQVTGVTSAFFEPALDYIVVKIPRWDMQKFKSADRMIGSEMKSVGEVMAIGRSFPEALQKAVRMLNVGSNGFTSCPWEIENPLSEIEEATDRRIFALCLALRDGVPAEELHRLSKIDPWFLHQLDRITCFERAIKNCDKETLLEAKRLGFSDEEIGKLLGFSEEEIREKRIGWSIKPAVKQIDTLAGEFAAQTNYLYMTYHGDASDVSAAEKKPIIVLGSGPYCIGSSVEFDWCAVNALKSLRGFAETTVMINSNPETVSTDYDESDRLYFEELSLERVRDIADFENSKGIIVSVGGQIANNIAAKLGHAGYPILGTPVDCIDMAENRQTFSSLLNDMGIDQPEWEEVRSVEQARAFALRVGFPVLVRPSYVLSGAAMNVIYSEGELHQFLKEAVHLSRSYPVVISQFIQNAKELEIDGVASEGHVVIKAITEHIENAGVHSGDATVVIPPQRLYLETIRRTKQITRKIVKALRITGPFNIQFIACDNSIKVIECNVRASRSFPFVSKVTNHNFIDIAIRAMLGKEIEADFETLELDCVGVKSPQFSYNRLKGANPVAQVEMASTGEVACLGATLHEAFFRSWHATGQGINGKNLLVSIGGNKKQKFLDYLRALDELGWKLYATEGTHDFLVRNGIAARFLYKASEALDPNVTEVIANKQVDLIINIPNNPSQRTRTDGFRIRRYAIDHNIPLITNIQIAQLFLHCLTTKNVEKAPVLSRREYAMRDKEHA